MSQRFSNTTFVTSGQFGTADYTSAYQKTAEYDECWIQVQWATAGTPPAGNLYFLGRTNSDFTALQIPLDSVMGSNVTHTPGEAAVAYSGAGSVGVLISPLPPELAVFLDRSAGSTNTDLRIAFEFRKYR